MDRALKPLGITRSQWWVLAFLSRHDGMTQTSLANDLDLKIPEKDLDHAAETLVALKATLLEMVEADEADDDRADVNIMALGDN